MHHALVIHEKILDLQLAKLFNLHFVSLSIGNKGLGQRLALRKRKRNFLHAGKKNRRGPGASGKESRKGNHLMRIPKKITRVLSITTYSQR